MITKITLFTFLCFALAPVPAHSKTCSTFEPISCQEILNKLDWIKIDLETRCQELQDCIDIAEKKLDNLQTPTCDQAIAIDQDFMNMPQPQITQPGVYCLVESVTGSLLIDADNVTVNLNSFSISDADRLIECNNHTDITIQGFGVLKDASTNGVLFTTCTGVIIDTINFEGCPTALQFSGVDTFRVDQCSVVGSTIRGMFFDNSRNGKVSCCLLHDNSLTFVIFCNNSQNLIFSDIKVENNICLVGYRVNDSNNCQLINSSFNRNNNGVSFAGWQTLRSSDCILQNCEAQSNGLSILVPTFTAFSNSGSNKIVFDFCRALNNVAQTTSRGFLFNNSTNCCVLNCLSKENSTNGFEVVSSTNCYLNNNKAIKNGTDGFFWDGANNNVFLSNYAEGNTTNYSGVPTIIRFDTTVGEFRDPVNSCTAVSPSDWDNISVEPCVQP